GVNVSVVDAVLRMMIHHVVITQQNAYSSDLQALLTLFSPVPELHRLALHDPGQYWTCFGPFPLYSGRVVFRFPVLPQPLIPAEMQVSRDILPVLGARLFAGMSPVVSGCSGLNLALRASYSEEANNLTEDRTWGFLMRVPSHPILCGVSSVRDTALAESRSRIAHDTSAQRALERNYYTNGILLAYESMRSDFDGGIMTGERGNGGRLIGPDAEHPGLMENILCTQAVARYGKQAEVGFNEGPGFLNDHFFGDTLHQLWRQAISCFPPGVGDANRLGIFYDLLQQRFPLNEAESCIRLVHGDRSMRLYPVDPRFSLALAMRYRTTAGRAALNEIIAQGVESPHLSPAARQIIEEIRGSTDSIAIDDLRSARVVAPSGNIQYGPAVDRQMRDLKNGFDVFGVRIIVTNNHFRERTNIFDDLPFRTALSSVQRITLEPVRATRGEIDLAMRISSEHSREAIDFVRNHQTPRPGLLQRARSRLGRMMPGRGARPVALPPTMAARTAARGSALEGEVNSICTML
ncbi:MAG: hypothetical protein WCG78_08955, partial [Candidatus Omnitrophota bacterium]